MPGFIKTYVKVVDAFNYYVGRFAMYLLFVLMGILFYSSFSKIIEAPSLWTLEMAQFAMVAYYILGGPYAIQMNSNVRMDLFYADWTPRKKAWFDAFTVFFLIFFLCVLLYGGWDSTSYSFKYNERSPTAWRPYLWPIKVIMLFGFVLMLLQAIAEFIRDLATIRGEEL